MTTPLTPQYVWLPTLEAYFVDKDTGLPLASGYILFYEDTQRTIGKQVFQLTGSPPNYDVIPYGFYNLTGAWQVTLDADGTIDQPLYFYPYDVVTGAVENYFIQIFNSGGVLQRSLENIPNIPGGGGGGGNIITANLVANPQFSQNYVPNPNPITPAVAGQINQAITQIAPGGWSFERSPGSTATDIILFPEQGYLTNPPSNPKYFLEYKCTVSDPTDAVKDIRLKYWNVNKFASTTQMYTFGFEGTLNIGSSLTVQLHLIKNFGTGGTPSPTTDTLLTTFTLTNSFSNQFFAFIFGANTGTTLGTNGNDYLQLALRFPNSVFDVSLTDFVLAFGDVNTPTPPDLPDYFYSADSLAGYQPPQPQNGATVGLPIINTLTGYVPDGSVVGDITLSLQAVKYGYLLCDGSSYEANASSTDGIPYLRLANFFWNPTYNCYPFGSGSNWLTTTVPNATNFMRISTNQHGSTAHATDGTTPTTFTINAANSGASDGFNLHIKSLYCGNNQFALWTDLGGVLNLPSVQTSGFTNTYYYENTTEARLQTIFQTIGASGIPQSSYFFFSTNTNDCYVWFNINGGGTDPGIGGRVAIQAQILSTYTAQDVAIFLSELISGNQISTFTTKPASGITPGAFFNIFAGAAGTTQYHVYYTIGGVGTNPFPGTDTTVLVALVGTETAEQVAVLTQAAVNFKFFSVPDYQGAFPRIYDPTGKIDFDRTTRWSYNNINQGVNIIGSMEFDVFLQHYHPGGTSGSGSFALTAGAANSNTANAGGFETRPFNFSVNAFIHY